MKSALGHRMSLHLGGGHAMQRPDEPVRPYKLENRVFGHAFTADELLEQIRRGNLRIDEATLRAVYQDAVLHGRGQMRVRADGSVEHVPFTPGDIDAG